MLSYCEHSVTRCANSLRQRHADKAAGMVERQIGWSREREAQAEVEFWTAVWERLVEASPPTPRILVH